jgi:hypothetical protein
VRSWNGPDGLRERRHERHDDAENTGQQDGVATVEQGQQSTGEDGRQRQGEDRTERHHRLHPTDQVVGGHRRPVGLHSGDSRRVEHQHAPQGRGHHDRIRPDGHRDDEGHRAQWAHVVVEGAYTRHEDPDTHRSLTETALRLTQDEARQLTQELSDVVDAWRRRTLGRDPSRRTYLYLGVVQPHPGNGPDPVSPESLDEKYEV